MFRHGLTKRLWPAFRALAALLDKGADTATDAHYSSAKADEARRYKGIEDR